MKVGTEVTMHGCGEADLPKYKGKIFVTACKPHDLCGSEVVALNFKETGERAASCFATEFLVQVNPEESD